MIQFGNGLIWKWFNLEVLIWKWFNLEIFELVNFQIK